MFSDGICLEYGPGQFDAWCIYWVGPLTGNGVGRRAPRDVEYFRHLRALAEVHGHAQLYADFIKVYQVTGASIRPAVLRGIERLAAVYGQDALAIEKLLTLLYAAMVAEENKARAVLKKRIKRLGLHQVLVENLAPEIAAEFSRGKSWRILDAECRARGF